MPLLQVLTLNKFFLKVVFKNSTFNLRLYKIWFSWRKKAIITFVMRFYLVFICFLTILMYGGIICLY